MSSQRYEDGTLIESWDDETRTYTDHRLPLVPDENPRPYDADENAAADARARDEALAVSVADIDQRVGTIEAHLWPAPPEVDPAAPEPPADALTPEQWAGMIPPGGLVLEADGVVYRNVWNAPSIAPSAYPGGIGHAVAIGVYQAQWTPPGDPDPDPDPDRPAGYVGTWDADTDYAIGDVVDRADRYYRALVAHGAAYQGTWGPPTTGVWEDMGPV